MATSSQDQSTTVNTSQNQVRTNRGRFWLRLIITFVVIILIVFVILVVLTATKILPPQWFAPLLTTLGPAFGSIGAFINTTLSDKDVQQAFRKRLIGILSGDAAGEKTSSNNATSTANTANEPLKTDVPNHTNTPINLAPIPPTTQLPAPPPPSSDTIFFVNTRLTNPKEFYGRALERAQLLSRTRNGGCTSIIGPRRIGKTWLMTYLRLVATQELGPNFRIGYMNAALPSIATIAGFSGEALKALGYPSYSLPEHPDLKLLENFVLDMVQQNHTPILCIDEFEGLTHRTEFDRDFFDGLRAITEIGLGLVVLSKKPLIEIVNESTRTSPFFNVFLQLPLAPFNREDADKFLQEKGTQAQFTDLERAYVRANSRSNGEQFPPLRLQLAGDMLLNEKRVADPATQQSYHLNDPEYWQAFKERVDIAYSGIVKS